jgi:hypothetical protein
MKKMKRYLIQISGLVVFILLALNGISLLFPDKINLPQTVSLIIAAALLITLLERRWFWLTRRRRPGYAGWSETSFLARPCNLGGSVC